MIQCKHQFKMLLYKNPLELIVIILVSVFMFVEPSEISKEEREAREQNIQYCYEKYCNFNEGKITCDEKPRGGTGPSTKSGLGMIIAVSTEVSNSVDVACLRANDKQHLCHCLDNCDFNIVSRQCINKQRECRDVHFSGWTQVRIAPRYYSIAGLICFQGTRRGNDNEYHQIYALNLGNSETYYQRRGAKREYYTMGPQGSIPTLVTEISSEETILYRKEISFVYEDVNGTRTEDTTANGVCNQETQNEPEFYKYVLRTMIKSKEHTSGCPSYFVPLEGDGVYELTIFFLESVYNEKFKRCFNIKINNLNVSEIVDIVRIRTSCFGVPITYLLKREGNNLFVNGFPIPVSIQGNIFKLSFCTGPCTYEDMRYIASAFYLRGYGTHNAAQTTSAPSTTTTNPSTTTKPSTTPDSKCIAIGNNQIECSKQRCEFDLVKRLCVHVPKDCTNDDFSGLTNIRLKKVFYAKAGVICKNKEDVHGNFWQVHAINLGDQARDYVYKYNDSLHRVYFKKETNSDYNEIGIERHARNGHKKCTSEQFEDPEMYEHVLKTYVYPLDGPGCLSYPISLKGGGIYELGVWMVDGYWTEDNKRCFDIQFNNLIVAKSVDLISMKGQCKWVRLSFLFTLVGSNLFANGFPTPIRITGDKFQLKFCTGSCGCSDDKFIVSAFYLRKYETQPLNNGGENNLAILSAYLSGQNAKPSKAPSCNFFQNVQLLCLQQANCDFNLVNRQCVDKKTACTDEDFSYWTRVRICDRHYSKAGVTCYRPDRKYGCNRVGIPGMDYHQVYAINLGGGGPYEPPNYVMKYSRETSADYEDPNRIRIQHSHTLDKECAAGARKEGQVYNSVLRSYVTNKSPGCLTYPIPLQGDGVYELAFHSFEGRYRQKFKRCFDVKINNLAISEVVDIVRIDGSCKWFAISYLLKREGNNLLVNGFPNPVPIQGDRFRLSFCTGSCGYESTNFIVSAIYLRGYGNRPIPKGK